MDQVLAAAKAGDPTAQFYCSRAYAAGFVFELSIAESMKWAKLSVEQNYPHAYYAEGKGVESHDRYAAFLLGVCYDEAMGVEKNLEEAFKHFLIAAEQGMPQAMNNVGTCYIKGKGVARDSHKAMHWYRRCVDAKQVLAIDNLIETLREQPELAKSSNEIQELLELRASISREESH